MGPAGPIASASAAKCWTGGSRAAPGLQQQLQLSEVQVGWMVAVPLEAKVLAVARSDHLHRLRETVPQCPRERLFAPLCPSRRDSWSGGSPTVCLDADRSRQCGQFRAQARGEDLEVGITVSIGDHGDVELSRV